MFCTVTPPRRRSCPRSPAPQPFPMRHLSMESLYEYGSRAGRVAPAAPVPRAPDCRHRLRRGHGARAQSRPQSRRCSRTDTRSPATAGAGSPTSRSTKRPSASTSRVRSTTHRAPDRQATAGLVHRPRQPEHAAAGRRARRLRLRCGLLRRRPALLGRGRDRARRASRTWSCPTRSTATTCASPSAQGFDSGGQFFAYLRDAFDVLYAEGDPAGLDRAEDAVDRPALPHRRPPGATGRARTLSRLHRPPRRRLDRPPDRHRPALDRDASRTQPRMTLDEVNALDRERVRRCAGRRVRALAVGCRRGVVAAALRERRRPCTPRWSGRCSDAPEEEQLALVRAHPGARRQGRRSRGELTRRFHAASNPAPDSPHCIARGVRAPLTSSTAPTTASSGFRSSSR